MQPSPTDQRLEALTAELTLVRRQLNRSHAYSMATVDVLAQSMATALGVAPDDIRRQVEERAALYLDATLADIQRTNPGAAAALDDRDLAEIPTGAGPTEVWGSESEKVRRLGTNVHSLWQLHFLLAGRVAGLQAVLVSSLARAEKRTDRDVAESFDRANADEYAALIDGLRQKSPEVAKALDLREKQPRDDRG